MFDCEINLKRRQKISRTWRAIEALENRVLLSAGAANTISINGSGMVVITGTAQSDTISGGVNPLDSSQYYFINQESGQAAITQFYGISQVKGLEIDGDPAGAISSGADADFINIGGSTFGFDAIINGGVGSDTIIGGSSGNVITTGVNSSGNIVLGSVGSDYIQSRGFNDTLRSGGGADILIAHAGANVLAGGATGSVLEAGSGNDNLRAGRGNSTLYGGGGNSVLIGGFGDCSLIAGAGHDTLRGGTGDATLYGHGLGSLLIGGFGNDNIVGGEGYDTIISGSGHDSISGGARDDFLDSGWDAYLIMQGQQPITFFGSGASVVDGSAGSSDTLVANYGNPTLIGGSGNNVYDEREASVFQIPVVQNPRPGELITQNDTVGSINHTTTVHLSIVYSSNGVNTNVIIPPDAGHAPNISQTNTPSPMSAVQAIDGNGTIQFQSTSPRIYSLGDFFNHWGVDFNRIGVGQFVASSGSGHTLTMTVNGVVNADFEHYIVKSGDRIVITFAQ